ncbi:MAG: hypothetical protein ACLSVD_18300 [Eggerthellaceae bacterium]
MGGLGIWYAVNNGFASDMSPATFMPDLTNTNALTYLSIILFNFMGFEVICTFAGAMKNPRRTSPRPSCWAAWPSAPSPCSARSASARPSRPTRSTRTSA